MGTGKNQSGAVGRVTVRFGPRDEDLYTWLFFGQPEDMSRVIKRALYLYSGIAGGEYLGIDPRVMERINQTRD